MEKTKTRKTIWLVGGGTGGHVVPLLAVAEELAKHKGIRLMYVGDAQGRDVDMARRYGLTCLSIPSGKLRRHMAPVPVVLNLRDAFLFILGIIKSIWLIRRYRPGVVFSKGGPVALPVVLAAAVTRVPVVTHESDSVMGRANRVIANMAQVIMTAFPAALYPDSYASKIKHVGLPLRSEFCNEVSVTRTTRPMILVTCGSQGSASVNELILALLPDLLKEVSVVHITGEYSYLRFKKVRDTLPAELQEHYVVLAFTPDIADYMRESALMVMRSGSQIFEGAALHKPMILIPLPTSANNHQVRNAEIFSEHHAALMLSQNNLTPERLYETIRSVLDDAQLRRQLKEGTRAFQSCSAARGAANIILEYVKE